MIQFTFTEKDTEYCDIWLSFYPKRDMQTPFRLQLEEYGYFDPRPQFKTNITSLLAVILPFFSLWFLPLSFIFLFFGWGSIYLSLPYNTGKGDECESPQYRISTFTNSKFITELWLVWGKKRNHIALPWALQWVRTSTKMKEGYSWFHETKNNKIEWKGNSIGSYDWLEKNKHKEVYSYVDYYDNSIVNATISVKEMEWRPRWFKWTRLFSVTRKYIDIEFDKEVGKRKGSWKGGVLGCSYTMIEGETPSDTLSRMEKERKF